MDQAKKDVLRALVDSLYSSSENTLNEDSDSKLKEVCVCKNCVNYNDEADPLCILPEQEAYTDADGNEIPATERIEVATHPENTCQENFRFDADS